MDDRQEVFLETTLLIGYCPQCGANYPKKKIREKGDHDCPMDRPSS